MIKSTDLYTEYKMYSKLNKRDYVLRVYPHAYSLLDKDYKPIKLLNKGSNNMLSIVNDLQLICK